MYNKKKCLSDPVQLRVQPHKFASQLIRVFPWDDLMQIKPGHPDATIRFDQIVHRTTEAILDYSTEADDDPGIADLRDRFTPIRSLRSKTQYQPNQGS